MGQAPSIGSQESSTRQAQHLHGPEIEPTVASALTSLKTKYPSQVIHVSQRANSFAAGLLFVSVF